jgi:hypothetical protein
MMAAAFSAALMLPAFVLSADHGGRYTSRVRRSTTDREMADQVLVGSTLWRAAIAFAVSESGPGGATKIASR